MKVDRATLATLYRFDLRMLLRDKRTVMVSIVLPILVMPLIIFSSSLAEKAREKRQEAQTFEYAISGPQAEQARDLIAAYEAPEPSEEEVPLTLAEAESADPRADLEAQEIHFFVEALPPGTPSEVEAEAGGEETTEAVAETVFNPKNAEDDLSLPLMRLVYRANWDPSETAMREMRHRLREVRRAARYAELAERGFPVDPGDVAVLEERDLASDTQLTGATVGRWATALVLMLLSMGGSVVAADAIAGEKERGTLETVLTTAASRREIVAAKMLVILTVGLVITVTQLMGMLAYMGLGLIDVPASFAVDLSPATIVTLLFLLLPLAALAGSALLLVSGYAKTYKEFQLFFFPAFLLLMAPTLAAALPGVQLRSAVVAVPIANLSVAVREVMVGRFDVLFLGIAWVVSMAAAVAAGRATLTALSTERLITASEIDRAAYEGGAGLLERHVLRWFAAGWIAIFLVSLNFEGMQALEPQILFNLVIVFLGGSLCLLWRYKVPVKEALALRPVKPMIWLAVLIGAPAFQLAGQAVARLSFELFPISERALEELGNTLLPGDVPLWKMLLLIAVLPGICEEIAFRGVLLHSLRKRFRPWALVLIVAVVFALFHMTLIRLLPTAVIGIVLGVVTIWTGSIFPAMVWHAINNGVAVLAARQGLDLTDLDLWMYGAGMLVAALALTLIWRHRTPYPGLLTHTGRQPRP